MLIWINGPFGGGKTQTAHELQRRLPGSVICDPEHVGFGLHRMLPPELSGDFQDISAWRQGVVEVLELVLTARPTTVIVPMTVVEPEYFRDTVDRLRDRGHDVRHFALLAERATVLRRLRERGLGHVVVRLSGRDAPLGRESFAVAKLDRCLEQLARPEFARQIQTDALTVAQVADEIARLSGLTLIANTDSRLRGWLRRAWIGVHHIRFD